MGGGGRTFWVAEPRQGLLLSTSDRLPFLNRLGSDRNGGHGGHDTHHYNLVAAWWDSTEYSQVMMAASGG